MSPQDLLEVDLRWVPKICSPLFPRRPFLYQEVRVPTMWAIFCYCANFADPASPDEICLRSEHFLLQAENSSLPLSNSTNCLASFWGLRVWVKCFAKIENWADYASLKPHLNANSSFSCSLTNCYWCMMKVGYYVKKSDYKVGRKRLCPDLLGKVSRLLASCEPHCWTRSSLH